MLINLPPARESSGGCTFSTVFLLGGTLVLADATMLVSVAELAKWEAERSMTVHSYVVGRSGGNG